MQRHTFRVTKNNKTIFSSRESNVQSSWIIQKTDPLVIITSHATEDNVIFLTSLESIDARNFNFLIEILAIAAILLHGTNHIRTLTLIRSDNSNLTRLNTSLEELGDDLFAVCCLGTKVSDYLVETDRLRKDVPLALISS